MSSYKARGKKIRLSKAGKQTKWAPLWIIPKIYKGLRKVHPARFTAKKRTWRKSKIKA